jgi:hypothetical protein
MGCTTCKKKKPVTKLEPIVEETITFTDEQIKLAYHLLGGIKQEEKPFVNEVYKSIFNEDFDWECRVCVNTQARKLKAYIEEELKLKV